MIQYYQEEDYYTAKKQRKNLLIIYFVVLFCYLLFSVGMFLWYRTLAYKSPTITTVKIIHHVINVAMAIFSAVYLGIPCRRAKRFYKMNRNIITGLKETSVGSFVRYEDEEQVKDGVDFKALIFLEWSKYKKEFFERKVLVFEEKEFPKFEEGMHVKYVTQSNVLVFYTILDDKNTGEQQ